MATSHKFEADLPELTEAQLEKLYGWGKSSCEAFDVRMNGGYEHGADSYTQETGQRSRSYAPAPNEPFKLGSVAREKEVGLAAPRC